ncbi:MAG: multidrug effflux MFS transporter [Candidatus Amulumruptor caecigallinarius]|nr:multidrug effflux MFS transporter [Candidatus Amulumruptor caecigallinarius]
MANKMVTTQYPQVRSHYVFLVAFLVALSAFGSFVNDMYVPTLPEMARSFHCSTSMIQMGLTMGMIGLGAGQIIMGPISDRYGRKPILTISLCVFVGGAFGAVYSHTVHEFLGWRLVQGFGASGGYFLARTVPADIYGGRELAKLMALIGSINGFAPAAAPVLGGIVGDDIGWRGIFWILGAFAFLLIITGFFFKETLPESRREQGPLSAAFGEYMTLLKNKPFMVHAILKGTGLGLLFAYISSAPFIFQTRYGFTQLQFGLFMGFNVFFVAAGSILALKFKVLKDAAWLAGIVLIITTLVEALVLFFVDDFWAYEIGLLPMLFCLGMIFTVGNTLAMNEGRDNAGAASAIVGVAGYIFGAIVAPLVGLGDIRFSTGIVFIVMGMLILASSYATKLIPADLNSAPKPAT